MASIVAGFEYDIFISYRHNDNRSGWVRNFVDDLSQELATTLKQRVSIYFDENQHDGLLETHLVNESLNGKLACLIFIPIISQTYCDPTSYAWQHEFLVFKNLARNHSIDLKVKLSNGNVVSRILPIKIHDLDTEDKKTIEDEIGPLRAIDFVFRSPGVNRPIRMTDGRLENLNKTQYRDQINKVANSIKEIIASCSVAPKGSTTQPALSYNTLSNNTKKKSAYAAGILLVIVLAFFIMSNFFKSEPEFLDRSIAVLPFDDLSETQDQEYFSDGISEEIINALADIKGLRVPGRTSSFSFKKKKMKLTEIGEQLNVSLILEGSVRKSGSHLRITTQLIDAKTGFHLWSETYNHELKDIFKAQEDVTKDIVKQLQRRLGISGALAQRKLPTQNLESYDLYWKGHQQFMLKGEHVVKAQELLKEAIRLDPDFALAHAGLAEAYSVFDLGFGNRQEAMASARNALAIDSTISSPYAVIGWVLSLNKDRLQFVKDYEIIHTNFERAIELDPQNSTAYLWYGLTMQMLGRFSHAADMLSSAVELDPLVPVNIGILGDIEYWMGRDSLGYVHLQDAIKLGWRAGNQRMALYHLEHQNWKEAEFFFKEHAKLIHMGSEIDYHELIVAMQKKDLTAVKRILDSIENPQGFVVTFKGYVYYLVGDYAAANLSLSDSFGFGQALRPNRKKLRSDPAFRKFIDDKNYIEFWKQYGWPDVCFATGENDYACK